MTTKVTKESLARKIGILESDKRTWGELSLSQEYQLEAYRMLIDLMPEVECSSAAHNWIECAPYARNGSLVRNWYCLCCEATTETNPND